MIHFPIRTLADIEMVPLPQSLSGPVSAYDVFKIELAAALPLCRDLAQFVHEVMTGFSLNYEITWED